MLLSRNCLTSCFDLVIWQHPQSSDISFVICKFI
uniref:Uncharacterized protein n=1 Tax=Arundo donax TaxID=35708 RepID=A0A0A9CHV5_ARUDO